VTDDLSCAASLKHPSPAGNPPDAPPGRRHFRRESGGGSGYCFAVHLAHLRLRDFRNYARLDTDFSPGFHLLLGRNAQGKTNILEAIYLLATLRSFRGVGGAPMVRHHQEGYFVGARVVAEGTHKITMFWSPKTRRLTLNDEPVRRLSDYFGLLRVVVFCTEDLQLVKGPASRRRRFLNLLLAQTHPASLSLLQRYTRAVRSRNALLKQQPLDEAALEKELLKRGIQFILDDPVRYLKLSLSRIPPYFMFWPSAQSGTISNLSRVFSFGIFWPFMLGGLIYAPFSRFLREKLRPEAPLALIYLFIVAYAVIHILTWTLIRYRLPIDALLVIFAALALAGIWAFLREHIGT
jgi:hypothetical protein